MATDEWSRMTGLTDMAAWNRAHNDTTRALGSTQWYNTVSGHDFKNNAIATNGTMGDPFWKAFDWGRRTVSLRRQHSALFTL